MSIRQGYALVLKEFEKGEKRGICACIERVVHHLPVVWRSRPLSKHWDAFHRDVELARRNRGDSDLAWFDGHWMQRTREAPWCEVARARRIRVLKALARGHRAEAIKQACI